MSSPQGKGKLSGIGEAGVWHLAKLVAWPNADDRRTNAPLPGKNNNSSLSSFRTSHECEECDLSKQIGFVCISYPLTRVVWILVTQRASLWSGLEEGLRVSIHEPRRASPVCEAR